MNVGILGGTRFIGFHLTEALLARGATVSIFHRGRTSEPRAFSGRVIRVLGDRNDPSTLAPFFARTYDAVIDLSGYSRRHVDPLVSRWRGRIGHYLFCSTSSVYRVPPPLWFDEEAPLDSEPETYGGDKALVERAVFQTSRQHRWPVTVFRPQGVFGPFGAGQALYVFRRLVAREPVLIRPETVGKRINFLWIHDFVDCVLRAIGEARAFGEAFNVAGPDPCTPHEFSRLAAKTCGCDPAEVVLERRVADRLPELGLAWLSYDLLAKTDKVRSNITAACTPLADALARTWAWAKADPRLLQPSPQRWERQASEWRMPPRGIEHLWQFCDGVRRAVRVISRVYR